jgi:hypothetical protein
MIFIESMRFRTLSCITFLIFAFLFATPSSAQDAMPTKEETVNYINKKLQDVVGKEDPPSTYDTKIVKYTAFSFRLNRDKVEFERSSVETQEGQLTRKVKYLYVFDPAHLVNGDEVVYDCGRVPGESICLKFPEKLVKETSWRDLREDSREVDKFSIPVNLKIPEFKSRLIKAVKHLRDLAKAEDDPFSN